MANEHFEREQAVRDGLAEFVSAGLAGEVDAPMRRVYIKGLHTVPAVIITAAAERLRSEPGRHFLPSLPEWIGACADVIDDRRAALGRQARALMDDCPECHGTGWADAEGPNAVAPCRCKKRASELMAQAEKPIKRLALPSHEPEATT